MADAPAATATPAASPPAAAAPPNPAPPEAAPAPEVARLSGREALAIFQDEVGTPEPPKDAAPATGSSTPATAGTAPGSAPAADSGSAPASGDPSQPSTASQSSEPGNSPAADGQTPAQRRAFTALAEGQAKLRREQAAFDQARQQAQGVIDWDKAIREGKLELLQERYGSDIFERGARHVAGAPPKPVDPNDRVTQLEQRLDNERQERERQAVAAQTAQGHQIVRGMLEKAGDDVAAVVAFGREGVVFDAFSLYVANNGIKVQNGCYFAPDGTPLADSFEADLVTSIAKKENEDIVAEYGSRIEKVPQLRSRFAPAPAAAAPAAATPAAPSQASAPPAREAPAPATLTSRHGNDAAPAVSNGRRKTVAEVDDEIVSRYFGA